MACVSRSGRVSVVSDDRRGQVLPMEQIFTDGAAPDDAIARWRTMLVKELPIALIVEEPVRVVLPAGQRSEVKLRSMRFRPEHRCVHRHSFRFVALHEIG